MTLEEHDQVKMGRNAVKCFYKELDDQPFEDRVYSTSCDNEHDEPEVAFFHFKYCTLFKYLKAYPVNDSHFKRAPVTATKTQMVSATAGTGIASIDNWLQEEAPEVFDYDFASEALEAFSEEISTAGLSRDALRRTLLDKGYHSLRVRLAGDVRKYVYFHPDKTKGDSGTLRKLFEEIEAGLY